MGDFNDSLISCLWQPLWSSTSFLDTVKSLMQVPFGGLRFLRSILKDPQEIGLGKPNESIRDVIHSAGVINQFIYPLDHYEKLVDINNNIKRIKDQTSRSTTIRSPPLDPCFTGQEIFKGDTPKFQEVGVGFDDEAQTVINPLSRESKQLEIVPIVGMPGLGKTALAKKAYGDTSIEGHLHIRLWCSVSKEYDKDSCYINFCVVMESSVMSSSIFVRKMTCLKGSIKC